MMTSNAPHQEAFVWVWLPDQTEPVVAGKLTRDNGALIFNYGQSYLNRFEKGEENPFPLYEPELPLRRGAIRNPDGLMMPGCIRDASPDAWGRRVIINKKLGTKSNDIDTAVLDELTYLLESGSDRIGALDFQRSATEYVPRQIKNADLDELLDSARRVELGIPLTPELDQALYHGSSIGGARPKALIETDDKKCIAKFSTTSDVYSVVKAEFLAMRLAALAGLDVAPVKLVKASGKDVLLVERFDREKHANGWTRKAMVSALTLFGLDDMMARYASYETLAEIIRHRFIEPRATLKELYSRLVFNILCGNTDDHARNHAAFWDGRQLALTPAYDICPQGRAGNEQGQGMRIIGDSNSSNRTTCLQAAEHFLLSENAAADIFEQQKSSIEQHWSAVCDEAELTQVERNLFWHR